jgi:hypothetical protein
MHDLRREDACLRCLLRLRRLRQHLRLQLGHADLNDRFRVEIPLNYLHIKETTFAGYPVRGGFSLPENSENQGCELTKSNKAL